MVGKSPFYPPFSFPQIETLTPPSSLSTCSRLPFNGVKVRVTKPLSQSHSYEKLNGMVAWLRQQRRLRLLCVFRTLFLHQSLHYRNGQQWWGGGQGLTLNAHQSVPEKWRHWSLGLISRSAKKCRFDLFVEFEPNLVWHIGYSLSQLKCETMLLGRSF